jgi:DivIVA domain-containing protein
MELTPQALHDVEFREARRGGYNTRDVDDFLERVAIAISQLQDRLREAYHRAEAAESRLGDMQRQLDEVQRRGPVDGPSDADETLRRTLVLAQRTADATIKEAKEEASRHLTEAREEAAHIRAAAESDARRDAKVEIEQLASNREALLRDIDELERHVEEQRSNIRASLDDLLQLVDDSATLRTTPPPPLSEPMVTSVQYDEPPPYEDTEPDLADNGHLAPNGSGPEIGDPLMGGSGHPGASDGSMVASLQELPRREPLERREPVPPPPEAGPAPEPAGFPAGNPAGATGFFPDLNAAFNPPVPPPDAPPDRSVDDLEPIDAPPPPPPPPGLEHMHDVGGIPIEPGSRPSEWGRGVFDTDDDSSETPRFGRR